jgi:hypothetical protein
MEGSYSGASPGIKNMRPYLKGTKKQFLKKGPWGVV